MLACVPGQSPKKLIVQGINSLLHIGIPIYSNYWLVVANDNIARVLELTHYSVLRLKDPLANKTAVGGRTPDIRMIGRVLVKCVAVNRERIFTRS